MAYSEFPHTNYHDTDLRELIELYKKLVDEYDGTLSAINEVNYRLSSYESNIPHYVRFLMDEEIKKYIHGETLEGTGEKGFGVIFVDGYPLSFYKESNQVKNLFPKGLRR